MAEKIRVLIVDDSPIAIAVIKKMISTSNELEVVGVARNGREALEQIPQLDPNVICTDLHMPEMDGLEFTREAMNKYPRPILVISVSVREEDKATVFKLLEAGAVDVLPKPRGGLGGAPSEELTRELVHKIKIVNGVKVFARRRKPSTDTGTPAEAPAEKAPDKPAQVRAVALGASTGGPQAIQSILASLPETFPVPILCVQHISEGFMQGLVDWLHNNCRLNVQVAEPGVIPAKGNVYFPREGTHLTLDAQGRLECEPGEAFNGHRPSVTVTFNSAAAFFRQTCVGVLLTGMGDDGAAGLKAIRDAGGYTIAQDEKTSTVYGMPRAAKELGAVMNVLPLDSIASTLKSITGG